MYVCTLPQEGRCEVQARNTGSSHIYRLSTAKTQDQMVDVLVVLVLVLFLATSIAPVLL